MIKKYLVVAKDDLETEPHTWTEGLDYEIAESDSHFTLASNEGQISYKNSVRELVLKQFDLL